VLELPGIITEPPQFLDSLLEVFDGEKFAKPCNRNMALKCHVYCAEVGLPETLDLTGEETSTRPACVPVLDA